jgi:hypothetical protein
LQEISESDGINNWKRFEKQLRKREIQLKWMGEANERHARSNRKRYKRKLNEMGEAIRRCARSNRKKCEKE